MALTQAYVLHQRPYRETSLLLDVFTEQAGRLSLVARGVRQQKRRQNNPFQLFQPLWLSWFGRGELATLAQVETTQPAFMLRGASALCGLYVNELLVRLLASQHPEPAVFALYQQTLARLSDAGEIEVSLRLFEQQLLDALGYGLDLQHDAYGTAIEALVYYRYQPDQGLIPVIGQITNDLIQGRSLQQLQQAQDFDMQALAEIKQLMRTVLNYYLDGKPLKSRALFAEMQRYATPAKSHEE
ncbi:MAG TPA: DNA repair protein RecO [Methylophaga sp.]|nr:DNA repair protein RecO [Methylophaga sp.]